MSRFVCPVGGMSLSIDRRRALPVPHPARDAAVGLCAFRGRAPRAAGAGVRGARLAGGARACPGGVAAPSARARWRRGPPGRARGAGELGRFMFSGDGRVPPPSARPLLYTEPTCGSCSSSTRTSPAGGSWGGQVPHAAPRLVGSLSRARLGRLFVARLPSPLFHRRSGRVSGPGRADVVSPKRTTPRPLPPPLSSTV